MALIEIYTDRLGKVLDYKDRDKCWAKINQFYSLLKTLKNKRIDYNNVSLYTLNSHLNELVNYAKQVREDVNVIGKVNDNYLLGINWKINL